MAEWHLSYQGNLLSSENRFWQQNLEVPFLNRSSLALILLMATGLHCMVMSLCKNCQEARNPACLVPCCHHVSRRLHSCQGQFLAQFTAANSDKKQGGIGHTTVEQMRDRATATSFTGADCRKRALGEASQAVVKTTVSKLSQTRRKENQATYSPVQRIDHLLHHPSPPEMDTLLLW